VWFLVLWALGTAVRLIYLMDIADAQDVVMPILDSAWYRQQAERIAQGQWLPEAPFWRAPAYPYFLAPFFLLSGGDPLLARVAQVVLAGSICGLVYLVGRRLFGHRVGLVAGLLACGYQMFVYFSTELLATTLEVFANALLLVAVLRAEDRGSPRAWFVAGLVLGFSAVVRPNVLLFAVILFFFVKGFHSWRSNWRPALALAAGALVLVLPVTALNVVKGKDPVLIAYQGGVNFYIGNGPSADGKTVIVPGVQEQEYTRRPGEYRCQVQMVSEVLAERESGREMKPSEQERFWYAKTFRYVAADPAHFVKMIGRKLYYFWNTFEVSNNRNIDQFLEAHSPWLRPPLPWFGLIAPLGLVGAVVSWRRGRGTRLVVLFLAAQMISVVLFFVCARYRMSAALALVVFAAYGILWLVEKARGADWERLVPSVVLLAALIGFAHTRYLGVDRVADEAIHHYNQALVLMGQGRYGDAVDLLHVVENLGYRDPMVHMVMGNAYLRMDRFEDARGRFDRAMAMSPALGAIIHSDLGTYYASQGRLAEAETELRIALQIDPMLVHVRRNLGALLSNAGRLEEALAEFEEAMRVDPAQAGRVLPEMAVTLDRLGRREEAIETLRRAIEADRTNARAHALLATYLEEAGDLDAAREEWRLAEKWAQSLAQRTEAEEHLRALD